MTQRIAAEKSTFTLNCMFTLFLLFKPKHVTLLESFCTFGISPSSCVYACIIYYSGALTREARAEEHHG